MGGEDDQTDSTMVDQMVQCYINRKNNNTVTERYYLSDISDCIDAAHKLDYSKEVDITMIPYIDCSNKELALKAIDEFEKSITDKVQAKYCRADLSAQYVGIQMCDWTREIAESLREKYRQG